MKHRSGVRSVWETVKSISRAFRKHSRLEGCKGHVLLLLVCSVVLEYNARNLGMSSGTVLRLIVEQSEEVFPALFKMAGFVGLSVLSVTMKSYIVGHLTRIIRAALTCALGLEYFSHSAFYRLTVGETGIDNADQRITNDVREFCILLVQCVDNFLISPPMIVVHSVDVYLSTGFAALLAVYAFFFVGIGMQSLIGPKLVRQSVILDRREGSYRFEHALVREKAEAICLSNSAAPVHQNVSSEFDNVNGQIRTVLRWQFLVNLVGNFFAYFGGVANYAILLWSMDFSKYTPGETTQAVSQVGSQIADLGTFGIRVNDLQRAMREREERAEQEPSDKVLGSPSNGSPILKIDDLRISAPGGRVLLRNFSLELCAGQNVFVTGTNGSGKTSLVRTLMGLWTPSHGSISLSRGVTIACAPQEPVVYGGSLSDILDPDHGANDDGGMHEALRAVGLESLSVKFGGLHMPHGRATWGELLSPGQQQRLMLARLLFKRPTIAVLDETFASLDAEQELQIHQELWQRGVTTITVGHRTDGLLLDRISAVIRLSNDHPVATILFKANPQ